MKGLYWCFVGSYKNVSHYVLLLPLTCSGKGTYDHLLFSCLDSVGQRGALDSDDLLYLKEQMEAEEDAERMLRRTEKRAFAAFKISLQNFFILADTGPAPVPLPLRVEPKPKSGIRQQDLLKNIVEIRPKRTLATASHAVATKTLFIVYNKPRFELFCL
ncbi:hypothetical protein MKW94_011933 [Papaver nudicaule]|uniref:Uncharacterized protein n=1 Tax=Papaver nudicaule TaxID=74823 RepID=A0AA42AY23_PAPNU|nr:hypothetical protein [Papaver nudicaule]